MQFKRLLQFRAKDILDAINKLQDAVQALQPRKSSGTLQSQGPGGTTTRASSAATRATTVNVSDDRPARWQ
jgi:hypothetical protein